MRKPSSPPRKACYGSGFSLLTDLKRRGLLDDTLVLWGGEFGRTPMFQGKGGPGRDHNIKGFGRNRRRVHWTVAGAQAKA